MTVKTYRITESKTERQWYEFYQSTQCKMFARIIKRSGVWSIVEYSHHPQNVCEGSTAVIIAGQDYDNLRSHVESLNLKELRRLFKENKALKSEAT